MKYRVLSVLLIVILLTACGSTAVETTEHVVSSQQTTENIEMQTPSLVQSETEAYVPTHDGQTEEINTVDNIIKLNREQVRSRSKEYYLEIINNDGMDEEAVASATDAYIKLTEDMEMEAEAETLLMAKGYTNAIVSISENSVDVVVDRADLSDTERAQIEDIVQRKTNCTIDQIVITSITQ